MRVVVVVLDPLLLEPLLVLLVDPPELSSRPRDRVSGRIPRSLRAILRDSGRIVKAEARACCCSEEMSPL